MKQNVITYFVFSSHTEKDNFAICLLPLEFQEKKSVIKYFGKKLTQVIQNHSHVFHVIRFHSIFYYSYQRQQPQEI